MQTESESDRRALGLLELDQGKSFTEAVITLQVSIPSASDWAKEYQDRSLQVIWNQPLSGRLMVIDGQQRVKITTLACVEQPEGYR